MGNNAIKPTPVSTPTPTLTLTSTWPAAPRVFWTYWQHLPVPTVVTACTTSWQRHHPDFVVQVVTRADLGSLLFGDVGADIDTYLRTLFAWLDCPARESDLVRLLLLAKFGGVWLDASILLAEPLTFFEAVVSPDPSLVHVHFAGFHLRGWNTKPQWPVLENWAWACRPGSPFTAAWLQEFLSIPNVPDGTALKLRQYQSAGVDTQGIEGVHYLLMHVAAQHLLQGSATHAAGMALVCAEEGPYKYLVDVGWNSQVAVKSLLASFPQGRGVFKLRSIERGLVSEPDARRLLAAVKSGVVGESWGQGESESGVRGRSE